MKSTIALLLALSLPAAVAEPEDIAATCEAEGGCTLVTNKAFQNMLQQAYNLGVESTRRKCRNEI